MLGPGNDHDEQNLFHATLALVHKQSLNLIQILAVHCRSSNLRKRTNLTFLF